MAIRSTPSHDTAGVRARRGVDRSPARLRVLPHHHITDLRGDVWNGDAQRLWAAWHSLAEWEGRIDDEFNAGLGGKLLVLWTLSRLGEIGETTLVRELIDENMQPRFDDPLLEDIAFTAFALGAGWAAAVRPPCNPSRSMYA